MGNQSVGGDSCGFWAEVKDFQVFMKFNLFFCISEPNCILYVWKGYNKPNSFLGS